MATEPERLEELGESQQELDDLPIHDNGEPLVDFLEVCPQLVFAPVHPVFEFPRVHVVRESVARMLCEAARWLAIENPRFKLQLVEGYRPVNVQRAMNRHMVAQFRSEHPAWSEAQAQERANRFSAPPDALCPPPHITGGAIDLEIIDQSGDRLDFSSPFNIKGSRQSAPDAKGLTPEAQANRALLRRVLEPTGLTNYVAEWWHWSYGDSGWALRAGAPFALYDRIELPPDVDWIGDMSLLPPD